MQGKRRQKIRFRTAAAATVALLAGWMLVSASLQAEEGGNGIVRDEAALGLAAGMDVSAEAAGGTDGNTAASDAGDMTEEPPPPDDAGILAEVRGKAGIDGELATERLDRAYIAAGKLFSLRSRIGNASGEKWTRLASLLHEAAVRAGLSVVERHIGLAPAEGVTPGFEASLNGTNRDLQLYNPHPFDVWVLMDTDEDGVTNIRLAGTPPGEWQPPVIRTETERFEPGTMLLADGGSGQPYRPSWQSREGLLVKVYVIESGERKLLYKDFYPPLPKVRVEG